MKAKKAKFYGISFKYEFRDPEYNPTVRLLPDALRFFARCV